MEVKELTGGNFEEAMKSGGKVLVDFWEETELAVRFQVTNIPSLIFFKDGKMAKKVIGFHSREELEEILAAL